MASDHYDDEAHDVSNETLSYDNYAQGVIDELLSECKILYKIVSTQKKQILSLEEKINTIQKDFDKEKQNYFDKENQNSTCNECNSLSFQIVQLKSYWKIWKMTNWIGKCP